MKKAKHKRGNQLRRGEAFTGYLFTMPSFLGFIGFVLIPIVWAAVISFQKYNIFTAETSFVGLNNYTALLTSQRTLKALTNTLIYCVFCTFFNTAIGLALAIAVNNRLGKKLSVLFRSVYFFPSLVGLTFVAIIWQVFFQTDSGVVNYYLGLLGINRIAWLSDAKMAKVAVIILDVWKNCGMSMLLLLAGLQNIDNNVLEAASIDGANGMQRFFRVTFPLLSPQLFFVVVLHMTGALRIYESVYVLTGGGPGDATISLVQLIAEKAFTSWNYGQASALSMMLLVLVILVTAFQFVGSKWWVNYD